MKNDFNLNKLKDDSHRKLFSLQKLFTPFGETFITISGLFCISNHITLSYPLLESRLPSTSPIPAKSLTGFSPIGSDIKL
ncbi:hypothetical protein DERP_000818 [Dermatophagoides pteronyssinus]|uniref:Uncharacterized protein n=1 Tax=Dermatophagoides pteronyssinus TaxID=6956 RepID=A0ABQ8J179_DERPT|nr:hypothetical protein DERP_000818 [Dermatophagoides pteronyssinus]